MSSIIIFLYSKYIPQARLLLETIKKLDYVHTLCVDNQLVRDIIKRSSIVKHKKVPCFIVIYPNKSVFQYVDKESILFLNKLIEMENQKREAAASSKSSVSDILPDVSLEPPSQTQQPVPQPSPPQLSSIKEDAVPSGRYAPKSVQYKKENRGDTLTHSQNDLVNYSSLAARNNNISEGVGHENMAKSSISNNNKSDNLAVIEDIFEEENDGLLVKESKPTENPSVSKKSSMKDIMNDMIAERENLDTTNKKQKPSY